MLGLATGQVGLAFELMGAFTLALPGFRRSKIERFALSGLRWSWGACVIVGMVGSVVGGFCAWIILRLGCSPAWICACTIAVSAFWFPLLTKSCAPCLGEVGRHPGDEERERIRGRGLGLLAIGFVLQSLSATLIQALP